VVGVGWALLGLGNIVLGLAKLSSEGYGSTAQSFAIIFNMVLFVIPGLICAGMGALITKRQRQPKGFGTSAETRKEDSIKQCPFCAETIKAKIAAL
jgi:hypothetical protein